MTISSSNVAQYQNMLEEVKKSRIHTSADKIATTKDMQKLEEVAQDFESFFAKMLVDSMFKSINKSGGLLEENSVSKKIFDDMLHQEYADSLAKNKALGISNMIVSFYKDLL